MPPIFIEFDKFTPISRELDKLTPISRELDKLTPYFQANWGITASLTNTLEWELADNPHISIHMSTCPWNVRTEHRADLAQVYGHPIIDPSVIIRNF